MYTLSLDYCNAPYLGLPLKIMWLQMCDKGLAVWLAYATDALASLVDDSVQQMLLYPPRIPK